MTFQKSLKLTALGLGIASIALTGCKKNSNDGTNGSNGLNGKDGSVTTPTKVQDQNGNDVKNVKGDVLLVPKCEQAGTKCIVKSYKTDKFGNSVEIIQEFDLTKDKVKIVLPSGNKIPSNACADYRVRVIDPLDATKWSDITSFYTSNNGKHNGDMQVELDEASKKDFILDGGRICAKSFLKTETNKTPARAFSNGSQEGIHNKVTLNVRIGSLTNPNHISASETLDVVVAHVSVKQDGVQKAHLMPAGLKSKSFKIYGVLTGRDNSESEIRDNGDIELTDSLAEVELLDANKKKINVSYDAIQGGWVIDSSGIPISREFKEYQISVKIKPNVANNEVELPAYTQEIVIKVIPSVPMGYKIVKLNTNVFGRQEFDILAAYSDKPTEFKSIFDSNHNNGTFNVNYSLKDLNNSTQAHSFSIVKSKEADSSTGLFVNNKLTEKIVGKLDSVSSKRYIDVGNTPFFSSTNNNFYELEVDVEFVPNYLEDNDYKGLSANQIAKIKLDSANYNNAKNDLKALYKNNLIDKQYFVVSKTQPVLKQSFRTYDNNGYTKILNEKSSNEIAKTISLPQGGNAYDDVKRNLCSRALTELYVGDVKVEGYNNNAKISQLISNNTNFALFSDFKDRANESFANRNVICASNKGTGSVSFKSTFQNLESNELSVEAIAAVDTPVVVMRYEGDSTGTVNSGDFKFVNTKEQSIGLYFLKSNNEFGTKVDNTIAAAINPRVVILGNNQLNDNHNKSPITLKIEQANPEILKLVLQSPMADGNVVNYFSSSMQAQRVSFNTTPSNVTSVATPEAMKTTYFGHINHLSLGSTKLTSEVSFDNYKELYNYNEGWDSNVHISAEDLSKLKLDLKTAESDYNTKKGLSDQEKIKYDALVSAVDTNAAILPENKQGVKDKIPKETYNKALEETDKAEKAINTIKEKIKKIEAKLNEVTV
ncbi:hypothetical protein GCL60_05805 [Silvanigrella paludirubra]|uniref:Uncharacterized protein n=1 Tax=Silvanigrella paludirubra TaxID=2499159 RepID=A0A6N6VWH6_9BACT|nr:hypothetical protein [Silvanigrella paludirubra]KAB8039777.1 hypothetical protein GCL60_05805 [Silvanigrella paludirubra]